MDTSLPTIRDVLVSVGWIWPAYIQNRHVRSLVSRLRAAQPTDRPAILETTLASLYPPEDLAVMLLERYRKVPIISEAQAPIAEAIEAAQLGLFHAAVSTLFPVVEGGLDPIQWTVGLQSIVPTSVDSRLAPAAATAATRWFESWRSWRCGRT